MRIGESKEPEVAAEEVLAEEEQLAEEELATAEMGLQRLPFGIHVLGMFPHKGRHPVLYSWMALSFAGFLLTLKPSEPSLLQGYKVAASLPGVNELK